MKIVQRTKSASNFDDARLKEIGKKGYDEIKGKENYEFWMKQGTLQAFDWCNENACLPTYNFREGLFEFSKELDGYALEKLHVGRKGCPMCNMQCGHIIKDSTNQQAELDYENVGMLGPNIGIRSLPQAATLNRMADEWGLDTISLGNCIGFLLEASEKGLIRERIGWGDLEAAQNLTVEIGKGEGLGKLVSHGVKVASETIGGGSQKWAMHVKGLEISAYNCHACPGMALSFGTSPIGGHHKDAWVIGWEVSTDRFSYNIDKVKKVIELQRLRGGLFESLTVCRLPWAEQIFDLHWYPEYFEAITGDHMQWKDFDDIGDRIYALIRAYWKRENPHFCRKWDYPPDRWFEEAHSHGKMKGIKVDRERYEQMLSWYYELRGWDQNGIPTGETLDKLGLKEVQSEIIV